MLTDCWSPSSGAQRRGDETRRTQTMAQLQAERFLLNQLMSNMPDMIAFKDLDLRYTRINRAGCQKFGRDESEIIGCTLSEVANLAWTPRSMR